MLNMYSFWKNHGSAIRLTALGIADELLKNYWVLTDIPLAGGSGSSAGSKFGYLFTVYVFSALYSGAVGSGIDYLRDLYNKKRGQSETNWKDHPEAFGLAALDVAKGLLANYWVFTAVPLAGKSGADPGSKFAYLFSRAVISALYSYELGKVISYARGSHNMREESETGNLLPRSSSLNR